MHPELSVLCPTCKACISDDDQACRRCGANVSVWPDAGLKPLILPGNPALSLEAERRRPSLVRILGGTAAGAVVLFSVLFVASANEPDEPAALFATAATDGTKATEQPLSILAPEAPLILARDAPPIPGPEAPTIPAPEAQTIQAPKATLIPAPEAMPTAPAETATPGAATKATAAPPAVAVTLRVADAAKAVPELHLVQLVADTFRPGDLLQLRWTVEDRVTGRAMDAELTFTSTNTSVATVDRLTGMVVARKPGRVRILVDAGRAGKTEVVLTVRS